MFFNVCQENLLLGIGSLQLIKYSAPQSLSGYNYWASNFKISPYICYNLCCVGSPSMMVLTVKRSILTILTPVYMYTNNADSADVVFFYYLGTAQ